MWDYRARVLDNHDGDTVRVLLDRGFEDQSVKRIRLADVRAPELREPGGVETRDWLTDYLDDVTAKADALDLEWPWIVTTARIKSDAHEVETVGRYVATITFHPKLAETRTLNQIIQSYVSEQGYGPGY